VESVSVCQIAAAWACGSGPLLFSQIGSNHIVTSDAHVTLMMICAARKVPTNLDAACLTGSKNSRQVMDLDICFSSAALMLFWWNSFGRCVTAGSRLDICFLEPTNSVGAIHALLPKQPCLAAQMLTSFHRFSKQVALIP
jgi:hypothetical protein